MRPLKTIALLLVLVPAVSLAPKVSLAREKKPNVSAVFRNATFVYVESPEGDIYRPGLYPPDRQAIGDVEDALREWNRYKLTTRRADADIVIVVRKGRLADARLGGQVSAGQPLPPNQAPGHGPGSGPGTGLGGGAGAGVDTRADFSNDGDDMLRVYTLNSDGKLLGPIWNRTLTDGLDAPQIPLFRQLKDAVEKAYPPNVASQPAKQ